VTSGQVRLAPGGKVRIENPTTAAAAAQEGIAGPSGSR
jgi:hypothetical protein